MYLRPHPSHLILVAPIVVSNLDRLQSDCACEVRLEFTLPRTAGPEQPESWAEPQMTHQPASIGAGGRRVVDLAADFRGDGSLSLNLDVVKRRRSVIRGNVPGN